MALNFKLPKRKAGPTIGVHSDATGQPNAALGINKKTPSAALAKLSARERAMVVGLVVIVIIAVLVFVIYLPAQDNIAALEDKIVELEEEYIGYEQQIAMTPSYQESYESAKAEYNAYQQFFYPFLNPEEVDELITGMLRDYKLEPVRLTMTALSEESLASYVAEPLVAGAVPEPTDDSASEGEGEGEGPAAIGEARNDAALSAVEGAAGDAAGSTDTTAPGVDLDTAEKDTTVYVYTIDVQADGTSTELLKFLDKTKSKNGFEVVNWTFTDPGESKSIAGAISDTGKTTGSVQLQIKLYVFLGGPIK
jgi:type II secretory pathway component PulM